MMSFLYERNGKYQQALNVLEIDKILEFPQNLQDAINRERELYLFKLQSN